MAHLAYWADANDAVLFVTSWNNWIPGSNQNSKVNKRKGGDEIEKCDQI